MQDERVQPQRNATPEPDDGCGCLPTSTARDAATSGQVDGLSTQEETSQEAAETRRTLKLVLTLQPGDGP